MTDIADAYEILGLSRGATLKEVEVAYRRAVLKYHPDARPADAAEARDKFFQVTEAYRAILRCFGRGDVALPGQSGDRRCSPQDLAFVPTDWSFGPRKITYPAVDETVVFVIAWLLAIALAGVVAFLLTQFNVIADPRREPGMLDVVLLSGVGLVIYVGVLAATILALVATRQVVTFVVRSVLRRALPRSEDRLLQPPRPP